MSSLEITLLVAAKNTMPYTKVFCETAKIFLADETSKFQLLFIEGDSVDGTKEYLNLAIKKFPFPTKIISYSKLTSEAKKQLDIVVANNDNLFNECVWDFVVDEKLITTPLYLGLHIDIAFKKKGFLDYLVNRIHQEEPNVILISQLDLGSLEMNKCWKFDMPRFFPSVVLAKTEPWTKGGYRWSRIRALDRENHYSIFFDNGAYAFYKFFLKDDLNQGNKFSILTSDELDFFIDHFGYIWPLSDSSFSDIYKKEAISSRRIARKYLKKIIKL